MTSTHLTLQGESNKITHSIIGSKDGRIFCSYPLRLMWERIQSLITNLLKNLFVSLVLTEDIIPRALSPGSVPHHFRSVS